MRGIRESVSFYDDRSGGVLGARHLYSTIEAEEHAALDAVEELITNRGLEYYD